MIIKCLYFGDTPKRKICAKCRDYYGCLPRENRSSATIVTIAMMMFFSLLLGVFVWTVFKTII